MPPHTNAHSESNPHTLALPSPWVQRHLGAIPAGGRVLDLACGSGRHTRLLAGAGHPVLAVDRDGDAVRPLLDLPEVSVLVADLEGDDWPLAGQQFAGIVVTNYLWRPRLGDLLSALEPGGVLIYETFMEGNEQYGKPSRPEFLLRSQELLNLARNHGMRVGAYQEGYAARPKPAMVQAVCAVQP